ncbi:zinc finger protein 510-like [Toxorhynchites rutilus septentrionalis]|uniref:zinc finger protein 510-like n=1 Tax=Toxorhynchites rutilus septentrionalis TaxID=329112 RepID=UPI00247AA391|nr:zinc finger protein 510-like [Toxorhynchites rutilus septentrionalis]
MECCVPDCVNKFQQWVVQFPQDEELVARWKAAIYAGTGQYLSDGSSTNAVRMVCNLHFPMADEDNYQEPLLFFRDSINVQVDNCRLCLSYDTVVNMLDKNVEFVQDCSLQWMANKYFNAILTSDKPDDRGYFCKSCVNQINATHVFYLKVNKAMEEFELLQQKIAKENVCVKKPGGITQISDTRTPIVTIPVEIALVKQETETKRYLIDESLHENESGPIEGIIIKEEIQIDEPSSPQSDGSELTLHGTVITRQISHQNERTTRCLVCEKSFASTRNLERHIINVHQKDVYKCKFCNVTNDDERFVIDHINEQHSAKASDLFINCFVCGEQFLTHRSVKMHKRTHTEAEIMASKKNLGENRKATTCKECGASFAHAKQIVDHFKEAHPTVELEFYPCTKCDAVFFQRKSFFSHQYAHSNRYACNLCGRRHYSKARMAMHQQTIHGIPLPSDFYDTCPICNQQFFRAHGWERHLRTHKDHPKEEKRLACETCGKLFGGLKQLRIHEFSHSGDKPSICSICGKRFAASASLHRHEKTCQAKVDAETAKK